MILLRWDTLVGLKALSQSTRLRSVCCQFNLPLATSIKQGPAGFTACGALCFLLQRTVGRAPLDYCFAPIVAKCRLHQARPALVSESFVLRTVYHSFQR